MNYLWQRQLKTRIQGNSVQDIGTDIGRLVRLAYSEVRKYSIHQISNPRLCFAWRQPGHMIFATEPTSLLLPFSSSWCAKSQFFTSGCQRVQIPTSLSWWKHLWVWSRGIPAGSASWTWDKLRHFHNCPLTWDSATTEINFTLASYMTECALEQFLELPHARRVWVLTQFKYGNKIWLH